MNKVSVIVPVHNANAYLLRCVNSLLAQTHGNMEFIFVDDCSTDGSPELLKKHIASSPLRANCIFTSTPQNSGPGIARNIGLQLATGDYVAFADSDDFVEPDMYEKLLDEAQKNDADFCFCEAKKDFEYNKKPSRTLKNTSVPSGAFSPNDKAHYLTHFVAYLWTFLFKREFLQKNDIVFPAETTAEDCYFVALAALCADRSAHVDIPLYHYYVRENALNTKQDTARSFQRTAVLARLKTEAKKRGYYENFQDEIDFIFIKKGYLKTVANYANNCDEPNPEILEKLHSILQENVPNYRENRYVRKFRKVRIMLCLLRKMPTFATRLLKNS